MDLAEAREVAGLSQFSVALRSGVPRMRLSLAECRQIQLRPDEVQAIRQVLRKEMERRAAELRNALSTFGEGRAAEVADPEGRG